MLRELKIRNLAVVEDAVIPFGEGLNVLTGSTGAGKSIILSAVELLSGSRAKRSLLRRGADRLTVEGIFTVPAASRVKEALGMQPGENAVSIRREFNADGKSRIWINGMITTNAAARETTMSLLELHGQHGQQELLDTQHHIIYLDARGRYGDLLENCIDLIQRYVDQEDLLRRLREQEAENRRQEDFFRFQLKELEGLGLEQDLDMKLESRIRRLANAHRYMSLLQEAVSLLGGEEGSISDKLSGAERAVSSLSEIDGRWTETAEDLGETLVSIQEISRELERAAGEIDDEPENIEGLERRMAAIQRAGRKYGLDCNGLIGRMGELRHILDSLESGSDEIIGTEREISRTRRKLEPLLDELSAVRKKTARELDREVTAELRKLGMKGAIFETRITKLENNSTQTNGDGLILSPRGWDRVEFMIRTNIGENIHPLGEVASGGELSRITLVLKKLQAEGREIPTLIFDEIDAGLGADLGTVVAERLAELAANYQILCVTHIPQVASRASHQVHVKKTVRKGRTITKASVLTGGERVAEIARMLGGSGKLREELAVELLRESGRARSSVG